MLHDLALLYHSLPSPPKSQDNLHPACRQRAIMTRFFSATVLLTALSPFFASAQPSAGAPAQALAPSGPSSTAVSSAAPAAALPAGSAPTSPLPSATLGSALAALKRTLPTLHPEKWKLPAPVAKETQNNLDSIRRDLDNTLPPLLATADANAAAIPSVLPAYRNIEALYDVLLRVNQVAILVAPDPQLSALQQAINALEDSRRALGDSLQTTALSESQQLTDLRVTLHKLQSAPPPPAPVCAPPPAAPAKKPAAKPKPKPAPATTTPPPQ
jgi:hypothetical protein